MCNDNELMVQWLRDVMIVFQANYHAQLYFY